MRRVLTFLTAARAVAGVSRRSGCSPPTCRSGAARCNCRWPPDELYLPVAIDRRRRPPARRCMRPCDRPRSTLSVVVEVAVNRARDAGSRALLVMRGGEPLLARYFGADDDAQPAARRPGGAAAGRDGRGPGARRRPHRLARHAGRALPARMGRRAARPHHAAAAARGNQRPAKPAATSRGLLHRSPWDDLARLPAFATDKGVRMLLGNDFASQRACASSWSTSPADSTTCRRPTRSSRR